MEELSTPSETSQLQPLKQAPLLPVFVVVDHPFLETGLRILWPGGSASGENTVGVGSSLNKFHGLQEYEQERPDRGVLMSITRSGHNQTVAFRLTSALA